MTLSDTNSTTTLRSSDDLRRSTATTIDGGQEEKKECNEGYRALLRNKKYVLLWFSLALSLCGDWFNYVAALSVLSEIVSEDKLVWATAAFIVVRLTPPLLFLPIISWWSHRFNHLQTMIISTLFRSIIVLFLIVANTHRSPTLLFILAFLEYIAAGFYDPARRSFLPRVVEPNQMALVAIIDGMTWSSMMAFGSAIGGLFTEFMGINACFLLDSSCYLVATALSMTVWIQIYNTPVSPSSMEEKGSSCISRAEDLDEETTDYSCSCSSSPSFFHLIKQVVDMFKIENPLVLVTCFCKMAAAVGWGVTNVIVILFSQRNWVLGTNGVVSLGILLAIRGFAELITPLVCEAFFTPLLDKEKRLKGNTYFRLALFGFFLEFLGTLLQSLAFTNHYVTMIVLFVIGNWFRCAGDANVWCFSSAFLTVWLPFPLMGPVFSMENSLYVVGEIFGTVLGAMFETNLGLSFLPDTDDSGSAYYKTVIFIVFIWTVLMLALFCSLYDHWKSREKNEYDSSTEVIA